MKTYLCNFKEVTPPIKTSQKQSLEWLKQFHTLYQAKNPYSNAERVERFIDKFSVSEKSINTRYSFVPGLGQPDWSVGYFNQNSLNPDMTSRSKMGQTIFDSIFKEFYKDTITHPDHLLHVSCTHYNSPSAAQNLVSSKAIKTTVTHLYHMGCYASLPAIRAAKAYVADGARQVDIVHTETCSLHLNPTRFTPEQIVVQSLFSDGAVKYSCFGEEEFNATELSGLEILSQQEMLIEGTQDEMTWKTGSHRFDMTLSKRAPAILSENVVDFCNSLFDKAGLNFKTDKQLCDFAVHPGGPKIVDSVKDALVLSDEQVEHSRRVLFDRGNMSSSTLPHIWHSLLKNSDKTHIVTLGFGPGLTLIGAIFKVCKNPG